MFTKNLILKILLILSKLPGQVFDMLELAGLKILLILSKPLLSPCLRASVVKNLPRSGEYKGTIYPSELPVLQVDPRRLQGGGDLFELSGLGVELLFLCIDQRLICRIQ